MAVNEMEGMVERESVCQLLMKWRGWWKESQCVRDLVYDVVFHQHMPGNSYRQFSDGTHDSQQCFTLVFLNLYQFLVLMMTGCVWFLPSSCTVQCSKTGPLTVS